jgi:hypothetical protein
MRSRAGWIRGGERDNRDAKRTACEHTCFGWKGVAAAVIAVLACACEASTNAPSGTSGAEEKDLRSAPLPEDPAGAAADEAAGGGSATDSTTRPSPEKDTSPGPDQQQPAKVAVTPEAILAKLAVCNKVSSAPYAKDASGVATIDVCALKGAVFFKADMDIDCDGKSSEVCNKNTDASYQNATAATDSQGNALDAAKLPFIVVPGVSSRWSYKASGIAMGTVGAVIYNGKIEYGIVGDVGPTSILGEASYAMAKRLGINPDPSIGGTSTGVTYVIFTNTTARVQTKEDHAEAVSVGAKHAEQLLTDN